MAEPLLICTLTPPAVGAIAVVHLVGQTAPRRLNLDRPHRVVPARLGDEVLARWIPAADSLTGIDTVEITCHGGPEPVRAVTGAFPARRVDWTQLVALARSRGRIDEIQEEAHLRLPAALTLRAARMLSDQAEGALSRALSGNLEPLLQTARIGRALVEPLRIVLTGRPNAGKSTLLNALVEAERALVTPEAGTTRDPVSELAAIDGIPFRFVDTAGVDRPRDALEAEATDRARHERGRADLALHVRDASAPPEPTQDALAVDTKIDLAPARDGVPVCALDGRGIPELRRAILRALSLERDTPPGAPVVFTGRQEAWIRARLAQR